MFTVKEIMTSPALCVKPDTTIKDTLELLAEKRFSGVPVVDDNNKVIGIISDTDIIRYAHQLSVVPLSNLSGWVSPYADVSDLATVRKGFTSLHTSKVEKVMTRKVYTIHQDADAADAAQLMNRRKINRIPVIDSDGKLVGIVTRADMVQCMAKMK